MAGKIKDGKITERTLNNPATQQIAVNIIQKKIRPENTVVDFSMQILIKTNTG